MINLIRKTAQVLLRILFPKLYVIEARDSNIGILIKNVVNAKISSKAIIAAPAHIGQSEIGDYTYISFNSRINLAKVGKFCSIGPNLFCGWGQHPINGISTSPIFYSTIKQCGFTFAKENKFTERIPIEIGNDVFIGMNVTILDGIKIGDGAIIGAGSVVSKDIPPYAIAVGSPIKIIRYRFDKETITDLLKIEWWDFDEKQLQEVERSFFDVKSFIKKYRPMSE